MMAVASSNQRFCVTDRPAYLSIDHQPVVITHEWGLKGCILAEAPAGVTSEVFDIEFSLDSELKNSLKLAAARTKAPLSKGICLRFKTTSKLQDIRLLGLVITANALSFSKRR